VATVNFYCTSSGVIKDGCLESSQEQVEQELEQELEEDLEEDVEDLLSFLNL